MHITTAQTLYQNSIMLDLLPQHNYSIIKFYNQIQILCRLFYLYILTVMVFGKLILEAIV